MESTSIKQNSLRAALAAALLVVALSLAGRSAAQTGPVVSVDAIPDGANTATSVGAIDKCRAVSGGSTFTADVVIQGVTGIAGLEGHLMYNSSVLRVTAVSYAFLIGSAGGSLVELGDLVPDSDGDFKLGVVTFPLTPSSGSGVLARMTFAAVGSGASVLDLQRLKLSDALGAPIPPSDSVTGIFTGSVNDASSVVGGGCSDGDGDGVIDALDNCPTVSNSTQTNTDGDSTGDACDPDDDGDGYTDSAEAGTPLCGDGRNEDNLDDSVVDDGCPGGPAQSGTFSEAQFKVGTDGLDPCGQASWPSDFIWGGIPESTNKLNIMDLTSFLAPARRLDTSPGHPNFNQRWDLVPGRGMFANWIVVNDMTALIAGTTGFPPMFGGAKAFNGPLCPFLP